MMNRELFNTQPAFAEITSDRLILLDEQRHSELPIERDETGRITADSRARLVDGIRDFLKGRIFRSRSQILCAIPLNGVSIRKLTLPPVEKAEREPLLLLQIEKEFPLSPDELAWGAIDLPGSNDVIVIAARKDSLNHYRSLFVDAGCAVNFTVAATARLASVNSTSPNYSLIEVGPTNSELTRVENFFPCSLRVLPGADELASLLQSISRDLRDSPIFISDPLSRLIDPKSVLPARAELITTPVTGQNKSSALAGLQKIFRENRPLLLLNEERKKPSTKIAYQRELKWAIAAVLLALACFGVRQIASRFQQHQLAKQYSKFKNYRATIPHLDRELAFLTFLKTNQPAYVETLFALANSAPPGVRLENFSMNRRGELSFKGGLRDAQQVAEFRSKMLDSGAFSTVIVEEQTPTPDQQKLNVRISAQWNPNFQPANAARSKSDSPAAKANKPNPEVAFHD